MVSVNIVVLLVSSDEFRMNRLVPVGNRHHQPEVVALDVEHHAPVLEDTGASVSLLDFGCFSENVRRSLTATMFTNGVSSHFGTRHAGPGEQREFACFRLSTATGKIPRPRGSVKVQSSPWLCSARL